MKEKIFFASSAGHKLCAILSTPSSSTEKPVIVLCHGFSTSKESRTFVRLEEMLNAHNLSTFRFDFFGHGESGGKFEEITSSEAVDDAESAIRFLRKTGYRQLGLVGSSFGGLASIIAASRTKDLSVLVLKSPVSDYQDKIMSLSPEEVRRWREKGFILVTGADGTERKLNYAFYEDAQKIRGHEFARKIKIPTLIVHGDRDRAVPVSQSIKAAGLIKDCRLEVIQGADHTYSRPEDFEKMLELISGFITSSFS